MRAPQCREGTCVTSRLPCRELFHQSSSIISEKPRSEIKSVTWLGIIIAGAVPRVRRLFCTMARIDGRQIPHAQPRTPQPFQYEEPAREVRVDHHALPADLHEEAGVSDERHTQ